jgi:hypothetical protein
MSEFKVTVTKFRDRMRGVLIFLGHNAQKECVIFWGDTADDVLRQVCTLLATLDEPPLRYPSAREAAATFSAA